MRTAACQPDEFTRRALAGDPTLLADLFACYQQDLIGFLRQRCGDETDAEDAAQDAFVNAANGIAGFRGDAAIKTWLYRLAANACTRMRRGKKADPSLHLSFEQVEIPELRATIDGMLDARLSPLRAALEGLSDQDRAVLLLRDGAQMSARETGTRLGLTEAAVKSRLHRAREAVREQVGAL